MTVAEMHAAVLIKFCQGAVARDLERDLEREKTIKNITPEQKLIEEKPLDFASVEA